MQTVTPRAGPFWAQDSDRAGRMPVKPVRLQKDNNNKTNMTLTISEPLILRPLHTTIRLLTFTVFSRGKFGISLTNSVHLWTTIMTASLEAEREREESARKMFPLHFLKLWMSLLISRKCSRARADKPIRQPQVKAFHKCVWNLPGSFRAEWTAEASGWRRER